MSKIHFTIPYPTFIESIVVYFLLRYRKKHYGFAFRRIKLITNEHVDDKQRYTIVDQDDYQKLAGYPWQLFENKSGSFYAVWFNNGRFIKMHRVIMNALPAKSLTIEIAMASTTLNAICDWRQSPRIIITIGK
jgi:hypothetical protein